MTKDEGAALAAHRELLHGAGRNTTTAPVLLEQWLRSARRRLHPIPLIDAATNKVVGWSPPGPIPTVGDLITELQAELEAITATITSTGRQVRDGLAAHPHHLDTFGPADKGLLALIADYRQRLGQIKTLDAAMEAMIADFHSRIVDGLHAYYAHLHHSKHQVDATIMR